MTIAAAACESIRLIVPIFCPGRASPPAAEVGSNHHDRNSHAEGEPALEAGAAVGVGTVEHRNDRIRAADSIDVELKDRVGIERGDRANLGLGQEHAVPGVDQGVGESAVPRPFGLREQRAGEIDAHKNPGRKKIACPRVSWVKIVTIARIFASVRVVLSDGKSRNRPDAGGFATSRDRGQLARTDQEKSPPSRCGRDGWDRPRVFDRSEERSSRASLPNAFAGSGRSGGCLVWHGGRRAR